MMQPNIMNEGDLVRFKKDRIGLAENGETIDIIINIIHDDYDGGDFKAGDTGLIIAHSPETRHHNHSDDLAFEVLVHGKIYFLFDYEMVLVEGAERL